MTPKETAGYSEYQFKTGRETAEKIAGLYNNLSMEVGMSFFDPAIILTFAGIKPTSYTSLPLASDSLKEVEKQMQGINQRLINESIIIGPDASYEEGILFFDIRNYKALERVAKTTTIPEVPPFVFNPHSADTDLIAWEKNFKLPDNTRDMVVFGLLFGYPDRAIIDFKDNFPFEEKRKHLVTIRIPGIPPYPNCQSPNFDVHEDNITEPSIVSYTATAGKILNDFFSSPTITNIQNSEEYTNTLKLQDKLSRSLREEKDSKRKVIGDRLIQEFFGNKTQEEIMVALQEDSNNLRKRFFDAYDQALDDIKQQEWIIFHKFS